jgi:hypothetical protein
MLTQILNVQVSRIGLFPTIDAVQGDSGRVLECRLTDFVIPSGSTARIYAQKPSGAQIYNNAMVDGNVVSVDLTTQILAEVGKVVCQIEVDNGGERVTSFDFALNVVKSRVDGSAIESSDEFTALEDALNSIDDSTTEAENAVSAANQAVSDAQTAIKNANTAISGANTAASSANSAAEAATNAASAANTAAEGANTAAQNANEKASAANSAAEAANNAVDALEEALQGTVINDNSVSNLTTYSSQKIEGEFDDVNEVIYEIGGRNLILDSENKEFLAYAGTQITIESNITVPEWNTSEAKRAHGTGGTEVLAALIKLGQNYPKNGTYCASIYVKNNGEKTISFGRSASVLVSVDPGSTERVFVSKRQISVEIAFMGIYLETVGDEFDFIYWHPKVEIGSTPTRWTPAPEDIQNEIDGKLSSTGDGSSLTVDFTEAASVANITSGSTLAVLFGQILKNQNDFLDADTIQAAEDAGITGQTGITLLNSVLQKTLINPIIEEYDSGGYHIRKYANGYMFATGSSSLGPTWTPVGASTGFATASKELTIPDMTEAVIGFANLTQSSVYIFSPTIVVIGGKATLQSHRLSTSNANFTFNVAVLGKWK